MEKLRYLTLALVEICILKIAKLQYDFYFSNKKNEYTFLNIFLEATISPIYSNLSKKSDSYSKNSIKQILHK